MADYTRDFLTCAVADEGSLVGVYHPDGDASAICVHDARFRRNLPLRATVEALGEERLHILDVTKPPYSLPEPDIWVYPSSGDTTGLWRLPFVGWTGGGDEEWKEGQVVSSP